MILQCGQGFGSVANICWTESTGAKGEQCFNEATQLWWLGDSQTPLSPITTSHPPVLLSSSGLSLGCQASLPDTWFWEGKCQPQGWGGKGTWCHFSVLLVKASHKFKGKGKVDNTSWEEQHALTRKARSCLPSLIAVFVDSSLNLLIETTIQDKALSVPFLVWC